MTGVKASHLPFHCKYGSTVGQQAWQEDGVAVAYSRYRKKPVLLKSLPM